MNSSAGRRGFAAEVLVLIIAVGVFGACGGTSKEGGDAASSFCQAWDREQETISGFLDRNPRGRNLAEEAESLRSDYIESFKRLRDSAPKEIADDLASVLTTLESPPPDPLEQTPFSRAFTAMGPEINRVGDFVESNC